VREINREGIALIQHFEGFREVAYWDAAGGVWTVGYGDTGPGVTRGTRVTEPAALARLVDRCSTEFGPMVERLVTVPLSDDQFAALVSFTYNLGLGGLRLKNGNPSTLVRKINARDPLASIHFDAGVRAGGVVLPGLVRRRRAERTLFDGGDWRRAAGIL
jgi:lysozyme